MNWTIKKGDREPALTAQLTVDGVPIDLTGRTVTFLMRLRGATSPAVNQLASLVNAAEGRVSYAWQAGDTDVVGTYEAEFEIATAGVKRTVPSRGFIYIDVVEDLSP